MSIDLAVMNATKVFDMLNQVVFFYRFLTPLNEEKSGEKDQYIGVCAQLSLLWGLKTGQNGQNEPTSVAWIYG